MAVMAKKRTDRHLSKQFQIRMHPQMRKQLEALADSKLTDLSQEIREAILNHLKAAGYWPPGAEKQR
jgi:hypothetical protein